MDFLEKIIKPTTIFISCLIVIFFAGSCNRDYPNKNMSGLLLIPDEGELEVNYFGELTSGEILMAGNKSTLDADNRQRGIDTGTYYLIDPNDLKYRKVIELNSKTGAVFGAVNTPNNGIILWISDYHDSGNTYLVKYNSDFKEIKRIRTKSKDGLINLVGTTQNNSMLSLSDGCFTILGYPEDFSGSDHIIKYDINLNIIWQLTWGVYGSMSGMIEGENGSILVSSESGARACFMKIDNAGDLQFIKNTNYSTYSKFNDIENFAGGFLCAGYVFTGTNYNAILWKFNSKGDTIKSRIFKSKEDYKSQKLIATRDGGFICVFNNYIASSKISDVVKFDSDLNILWKKSMGNFGEINTVSNVIELPNENLVIGGYSNQNENNTYGVDGYVIILNKHGEII
jgi:hypothetical protein